MKTFEFTSYQCTLIEAINKDYQVIKDIRERISLTYHVLLDDLPALEGDLVEMSYGDSETGEVFTDIFVIGWLSVNERQKTLSGYVYPLIKNGKPSKRLKNIEGITSIKVIQKGGQNGND